MTGDRTVVELAAPPGLAGLYGKAVVGLAGGLVAGLAGGRFPGRDRDPAAAAVPGTELVLRGVPAEPARLTEYARVCGFRLTDTLPASYPQVLAFPLALALMTAPGFPFPAAGVVHLANRIVQPRPLAADQPLDLAVYAEDLRPHPRGSQLDLVTVATVAGAEVWRAVATYLHRSRSGGAGGGRDREPAASAEPVGEQPSAVWRVGPEVARAYAAVSGDRNPIHLSTLAARAFGFRRRIAHGMWTKARCLAQLAPRLPDGYAVEVTFRAPILLPATVGFSATEAGGGFAVHDRRSGRPHLTGTVSAYPGEGGSDSFTRE